MQSLTYADSVVAQSVAVPAVYGDVDFGLIPERLDADASVDDERFVKMRGAVGRVLG